MNSPSQSVKTGPILALVAGAAAQVAVIVVIMGWWRRWQQKDTEAAYLEFKASIPPKSISTPFTNLLSILFRSGINRQGLS
jgi:hypothetical protein